MTKVVKESQLQKMRQFNLTDNSIMRLAESVKQGDLPSVEVYAYLKMVEKVVKEAIAQTQDIATEDVALYGSGELKQGVIIGNAVISMKSTPGRWKFEDSTLVEAEARLKYLKDKSKQSYKNQQSGKALEVDPETGAEIEGGIFYHGKQTIVVSIKKEKNEK